MFTNLARYDPSGAATDTTDLAMRQAELIVKLYELRRETVMREARSYVGGEFLPRPRKSWSSWSAPVESPRVLFCRSMAIGTWFQHLC